MRFSSIITLTYGLYFTTALTLLSIKDKIKDKFMSVDEEFLRRNDNVCTNKKKEKYSHPK